MNSLNRKSVLLAASAFLLPGLSSSAQASSHYSGGIDFSYTVTAINLNPEGGMQYLSIIDTFFADAAAESGSSSYSHSRQGFNGLGVLHNVVLQAQDSIQLGAAVSDYFSNLLISFENTSLNVNDIFDINIDFSYRLSGEVSGQQADADVAFRYSNEDFSLDQFDLAHVSTNGDFFAEVFGFKSFGFILSAGQSENLYFDGSVSGQLEATVVPVPAAIWLFGSGFAGLLGMQRRQSLRA
ncbi:VPLPA-CTERM sorting domain-containing protein [Methylomonas sp. SURF-2]|uniref:VPLPA-CTERM sorting domain-containing protein n=1 Tax=Methylomonas subterranea TaxID=2952225 RepID=A0ABT1TER1_9GAMM|nr:VPLPA-CTERM sorting domain-containing protein [Methylomonas sp. SURF-2]MCQ8103956.1 VPLPA-CTERM sorting domain-containing protein [Methylomonas sp. SURF-2]